MLAQNDVCKCISALFFFFLDDVYIALVKIENAMLIVQLIFKCI